MKKSQKLYYRTLILHYYRKGFSAKQIEQGLNKTYSNSPPSKSFIYKWIALFKVGVSNLKDNKKSGLPKNTEDGKYDKKILKLISYDLRASIKKWPK